ncbi:SLC35E2 [Mytilus edulis]|uniref:SLC35E2 n=1 Tax=Mytilus edulis TaxID=6550 RepID=A0A8S3S597_MYTED|nr:SLC35E2 [Mytilus edulis]
MSEIKLIKDAESLSTSTDLNMYLENSMDAVRTNIGTKHIVKKQDDDEKLGLLNVRAFFFLILWYIFSAFTLFLNKYILTSLKGDPAVLGAMQMVMTTIFGFLQMYLPLGFYKPVVREGKPSNFWKNMILVGCMRFSTVVLGLIALKFVAVSFTETVKSSAPLFTCFISYALIGEYTGMYTFMSLIPIMSGLALCSAYELSFNIKGFIAALATNLTECLQNVYSKVLISGDKYRYTVANTVKRAFLIWISVILFGNPVTFLSGLGTVIVTIGVLLYTKAKEVDHNRRELIQSYPRLGETKDV